MKIVKFGKLNGFFGESMGIYFIDNKGEGIYVTKQTDNEFYLIVDSKKTIKEMEGHILNREDFLPLLEAIKTIDLDKMGDILLSYKKKEIVPLPHKCASAISHC